MRRGWLIVPVMSLALLGAPTSSGAADGTFPIAIYGASDVHLNNNKEISESVPEAYDAHVYSGCNLTTDSTSSSQFQGNLVAGCALTLDGSYTSGNVWARQNIIVKGGSCVGIHLDGGCGYGDDPDDYAAGALDGAGWVVSSQGNLNMNGWIHNPCLAVNGTITKISSGPACKLRDWVSGPDIYKIGAGVPQPPGFFPSPYACPAEAAAIEWMGRNLCQDPPAIPFPGFTYDFAADWQPLGYSEVLGNSFPGATDALKCDAAKSAIQTGFSGETVVNLLGMDCDVTFTGPAAVQDDLAIIHDGKITFSGITTWTGAAGEVRDVFIIHPKGEGGGESACSTDADGVGSNGADAQDDLSLSNTTALSNISVFLYTPCHLQADNNSVITGQMIGGTVTQAGYGGLAFNPMAVPGLDLVAPDTTISTAPDDPTADTTGDFTFSSELGATFECKVDSDPFGPCSGVNAHTTAVLSAGSHTFSVRATDSSGNTDASPASFTWTVIGCTITGTAGPETLSGSAGNDVICGLGGNDKLIGKGGNDLLFGGLGDDTLGGGDGNDAIDGDLGTKDMVVFNGVAGPVTADLVAGTSTGQGSDTIIGVEVLSGSGFADQLTGDAGDNRLIGRGGADVLTDSAGGADKLLGQGGNDTLSAVDGVSGNDVVDGSGDLDSCSADVGDIKLHCES